MNLFLRMDAYYQLRSNIPGPERELFEAKLKITPIYKRQAMIENFIEDFIKRNPNFDMGDKICDRIAKLNSYPKQK